MKKSFKLLVILSLIIMTTGCMKVNFNMEIGKDKSMNLTIIEAIDKSLMGDSSDEFFEKSEMEELENNGYYIEKYNEDSMEGYKISKKIDNIDTISTEGEVISSLDLEELNNKENYMFEIKKGTFKNTYKAKFKFDTSEIDSFTDSDEEDIGDGYDFGYDDDEEDIDDTNIDLGGFEDLNTEQLMKSMDLKFELKLPYKAERSNSTSSTDGGKKLTWDLTSLKEEYIEFEFVLYNWTKIYMVVGIVSAVALLSGIAIVSKKRG